MQQTNTNKMQYHVDAAVCKIQQNKSIRNKNKQ